LAEQESGHEGVQEAAPTTLATPRAPKRQRGLDRVAALLDAGAQVFAEKGYDAATMTEIAARAGAAIGSLYQFFPNKLALAGALVARYGERMGQALQTIQSKAGGIEPAALSDALVGLMLQVREERAAVLLLVDIDSRAEALRTSLRDNTRADLAGILRVAKPGLPEAQIAAMAAMVLTMLKSIPALAQEDGGDGPLVAQARLALSRYLS
jgi:AcrR family transcriptional regulator